MTDRLTSKRAVLVLMLASALVILVCGSRVWVTGSVDDAVLGAGVVQGVGSDVAPGALAAALVGLASGVAVATSGRAVRIIAACAALLSALLGAVVVISVLADPGRAISRLAAAGTGRTGSVAAHGTVEVWAWVALAATLAMGVAGLGALVGGRRWHGLSARYDAPVVAEAATPDPTAEPEPGHDSSWDQLSRGEDPTVER